MHIFNNTICDLLCIFCIDAIIYTAHITNIIARGAYITYISKSAANVITLTRITRRLAGSIQILAGSLRRTSPRLGILLLTTLSNESGDRKAHLISLACRIRKDEY